MEKINLIQRPSPIKCPKKYCYFWNQEMNGNSDSGYCSCLLGYCTRLNLFQGDNAPHVLLKRGNRFDLFENGICGIGEVL